MDNGGSLLSRTEFFLQNITNITFYRKLCQEGV